MARPKTPTLERVRKYLADHPISTRNEIRAGLHLKAAEVREALDQLHGKGVLEWGWFYNKPSIKWYKLKEAQ